MGRDPKKRDNYRGDAITLNRILRAIEKDDSCSPEWKAAVSAPLRQAWQLLMLDHTVNPADAFPMFLQRKAG